MSASPRQIVTLAATLAVAALLASAPGKCRAQYENDFDYGFPDVVDYQYFEPVDLDLNRRPVRYTSGLFFNYDKLLWALTSERVTIGDKNTTAVSEQIYIDNNINTQIIVAGLGDNGREHVAPDPYTIVNGLKNVPPHSEFGWGDRYEMGYVAESGMGIMIGIIDGNEIESEEIYGFGDVGTGFGSVHVNFRVPNDDFLLGFRDYGTEPDLDSDNDGVDPPIEETETGPGNVAGADGETDNIDGDQVGGPYFVIDPISGAIFFGYDFDDLHLFNIRFEQLGVRNINRFDGVEIMGTKILSNRHFMQKHQNQHLEVGYGARLFRIKDYFLWDGNVDLGAGSRWFTETQVDNQIVGPQFRLKWAVQAERLKFSLDGRCMLGYNIGDMDQTYGIGSTMVPGAQNNSAVFQPTYGNNGRQENTFSPVVEFRADLKYQLTRSIAFNLGYTAMFVDNITRASQVVDYTLPDIGLLKGGDQDIFINGVNFGVEFWH